MLTFDEIRQKLKAESAGQREPVVVFAQAADDVALEAARLINEAGIATAILVGDAEKIAALAPHAGVDLSQNVVIDVRGDHEAAKKAVECCVNGEADVICKGHMHTNAFLRAILDKEHGMRTGKTLCSVTAVDSKATGRMFLASDCAMIIEPDVSDKQAIIAHAAELARALGTPVPKVALLSAVEEVNQNMPDGYDAAVLCKMNSRGQIKGCVIDGPLSLDLALSPRSAEIKEIDSPVAGQADILIMPNLQAGNIFWKSMTYLAGTDTGAVVMGAQKPVVLTSRADSPVNKLNSIAMALLLEREQRRARCEKKTAPKKSDTDSEQELVRKVIAAIVKELEERGLNA